MEPQPFHPLDYLTVVNRRKWWFIAPLVLCIAAGAIAVAVWPRTYLSKAAIGVQSPTLSVELLRGMASMDPVERQRAIQQLLLSPTVLDRVLREEQIHKGKSPEQATAALRANLAQNIEVPPTLGLNGRPDPSRGIDLFYIGYTDNDAARAQRVANRVASVFVEENSKFQTNRAENSADVLEQQVAASQARLTELENGLRARNRTTWAGCRNRSAPTCRWSTARAASSNPSRCRFARSRITSTWWTRRSIKCTRGSARPA